MRSLFLLPALFCVSSTFAQNTPNFPDQQQKAKLNQSVEPASPDLPEGETIAHCEMMIKAIDTKVAYIQADQTKRESAGAKEWFDRMALNREKYVARKKALEEQNTTK